MVFDVGPLTWVKSEIDASLERARAALSRYAADADAKADLVACQTQLHQAAGAVQIVGLEGVTRVFEETEALVADLAGGKPVGEGAVGALERSIGAIGQYLSALLDGQPDQPLRLFPVYRDLQVARGAAAPGEAELYFPDLSLAPPPRDKPAARLPKDEVANHAKAQRTQFQRGFLRWLRAPADAAALADMRSAADAMESVQTVPAQRAFWWAASAVIDGLASGDVKPDAATRQACSRIEQQMKRAGEGAPAVAERAHRELLYLLARAPAAPASARVSAAQQAFQLLGTLPEVEEAADTSQRMAVAQALRESIAAAKAAWNRYAAGAETALAAFAQQARAVAGQVEPLRHEALTGLARELAACADALQSDPKRMSEAAAMEVATALLVLENAIDGYRNPAADLSQQASVMTARLGAVLLGRAAPATLPNVPLVDEMTRRAQEKLATSAVLAEMQGNLHKIEQALDAYFRDPARAAELVALEPVVHQVSGALAVLGEEEARGALERCAAKVREFAAGGTRPEIEAFEEVAHTLSGLGFYIEALKHGKADFAAAMRPVAPAQAAPAEPEAETVEQGLEQHKRETQVLLEALQASPADEGLRHELKEKLESIRDDADLVADAALGEQASVALRQLDAAAGPDDTQGLARTLATMAPVPAGPSAEAERLKDASEEAIDEELLAIFLEEAAGVLETVSENLGVVRAQPASVPHLTTIRRGFHTLKGSGRMVGLMKLGEAAWAIEQVMNLWMQEERPANADLLALIEHAHAAFSAWVAKLVAKEPQPDPSALVAEAERVKRGEPAAGAETAPSVPEAPAAAQAPSLAPEDAPVEIGPAILSPSLYAIFVNESRQLLEALERAVALLATGGEVNEEFVRVSHTLAGICGTAQMAPMHALGQSVEAALLAHRNHEALPGEEATRVLGDAVHALRAMHADVVARRYPGPRLDLSGALSAIAGGLARAAIPAPPVQETVAAPVATPSAPLEAPLVEAAAPIEAPPVEELFPAERRQQRIEDEIDPNLLSVFLEEAEELGPQIGELLRAWRREPAQLEHPKALQRALHTFKGGARMAGAMGIGELTHHMETRVEHAMALQSVPPALFDELETSYDRVNHLLEGLQGGGAPAPAAAPVEADSTSPRVDSGQPRAVMRVRAEALEKLVNLAGEVAISRSRIESEVRALRGALGELVENVSRLRHQLREIEIQAESQMQARTREAETRHASFDPLEFDRFTRFQEVTRMMAESVNDVATVQQTIARIAESADGAIGSQARMNRELQLDLMRVRMVPVGSIAERLHRIVRQTAKELGRRANLDLVGEAVEVDRSVLERMIGPLEHLLRNAVTHGIESPEARRAGGKPDTGEIRMEVRQEGQEVILTLSDDGAGLDLARIRDKALAQGLVRAGDAVDDRVLADLIFLPGFSTAQAVTEVAGRGVGMDVVKNEVSGLGGRIELSSTPGQGARFVVRLPLTTAVAQAVLVRSGERTCALPAVMVEQVQQLRAEQLERVRAAGQVEWASRRYPFFYLPELLGEPGEPPGVPKKHHSVLLLRAGAEAIALLVDDMSGNQEVVVKNIGPQLARVPGVTGATVLGTGEIVLIMNPVQLATGPRRQAGAHGAAVVPVHVASKAAPAVMVVDDSLTVRKITGRLLAREGYEVLTAKDGVDALEQLKERLPDVMLVDIEMPRMDGFELTRNVRGDSRMKSVPIIMITSRTADKHRNYAAELGVNVYLGKPYQEDELLGHIAGFVGR